MDIKRHMLEKFSVKEGRRGLPLKIEGVTQSPYADLDQVTGVDHKDPELAAIAERTLNAHRDVLSASLIVPERIRGEVPSNVHTAIITDCRKRFGHKLFYVMPQTGDLLQITSGPGYKESGILQSIGEFDPSFTEGLNKTREKNAGTTTIQLGACAELMNLPEGGLIVDMGARDDYERVNLLKRYAKSKKGRVVAHDIVPASAKASSEKIGDTPYLSLPPHTQFLRGVFSPYPGETIFSFQNVASVTTFGGLEEMMFLASQSGNARLCIEQTLGVAQDSDLYLAGYKPHHETFANEVARRASFSDIFKEAGYARKRQEIFQAILYQARNTTQFMMMELIRQFLIEEHEKFMDGKQHVQTLVMSQDVDLPKEQAEQYLKMHFFDLRRNFFRRKRTNAVCIGPFGISTQKLPEVPEDHLRIRLYRIRIEIGRNMPPDPKSLVTPRKGQRIRVLEDHESMCPKGLRAVDPYAVGFHKMGLEPDRVLKLGAKIAHQLMFEITAQYSAYVGDLSHLKKRFYKDFVEGCGSK